MSVSPLAASVVLAWPLVVNTRYSEDAGALWLPKRLPNEDGEYRRPDVDTMAAAAAYLRAVARGEFGGVTVTVAPVTFADSVDGTPPCLAAMEPTMDALWLESVERGEPRDPPAQVVHEVLDAAGEFHRIVGIYELDSLAELPDNEALICHRFTHRLHIEGDTWDAPRDWAVRVEP